MTPRDVITQEALSWVGTPYHHHARVKGAGVDCAQLLIAVYSSVGLIDAFDPGHYSTQWHLHRGEEMLQGWVSKFAREVLEPLPGDVVLYRFARAFSHAAIVIDWPMVVHAVRHEKRVVFDNGAAGEYENRQRLFYRLGDL